MKLIARFAVAATILVACIMIVQPRSLSAQIPDEFTNLKVLPKDISKRELTGIMRSYANALGLRCSGCHESTKPGSDRLDDLDFKSDKKPEKETARKMMRMVASINEQLGKMGFENKVEVGCVTCHHGVKHPETLAQVLQREIDKSGVAVATTRYRELRERYYGSGAYDFSPDALAEVAGDLAEKKDFDGAIELLNLNLEFSPKDADSHATLGRVYMAKGDKEKAISSFEKALAIDPNHRWAKQQLERAKSGQ